MHKGREYKYYNFNEMNKKQQVSFVKEMFPTIAKNYDFLNRFLSMRRDVAWRRFAVRKMLFPRTLRFLDVATGTADLAFEAARKYPNIKVTGVDFVPEMILIGRKKIEQANMNKCINLIQADALSLPFDDNLFDVVAIAFGIRNIPDKVRALQEMARVAAFDGQVMILEMNFPQKGLLRSLYDVYLNKVLPNTARLFTTNPIAYRYLGASIMNFPSPDEFTKLMREVGLTRIERHALTFGITHLYIGRK